MSGSVSSVVSSNSCAHCGVEARAHGYRFSETVGGHLYVAPADALRKARMLARRSK